MVEAKFTGVDLIVANTDNQALRNSLAPIRVQLGVKLTGGLGAGANPEVGRKAVEEDPDQITRLLEGADMVFITAGLGGGTGTGAAPVVASLAKDLGILTVAVVTKPFNFEGRRRMLQADAGLDALRTVVDTLITIPNQRLFQVVERGTGMQEAFGIADSILHHAVQGISDLILVPGLINLDFADVRTIMSGMGMALMGAGTGRGPERAIDAANKAVASPLLDDTSIEGARGILINFTGGPDLSLHEIDEAAQIVQQAAHDDANIIFGAVIDPTLEDELRITVIATGFTERKDAGNVVELAKNGRAGSAGATAWRRRHAEMRAGATYADDGIASDLEVPTYLRRQAD
jgi:cell division protein FtsZ